MYSEWSAEKPLHFIGHSMGGSTVRVLQQLLENGAFRKHKTSAAMIKSLTTISTPHNGTPFTDFLGLAPSNKAIRWGSPLHFLFAIICILEVLTCGRVMRLLCLDRWSEYHSSGIGWLLRVIFLADHPMISKEDWCVGDLSVRKCMDGFNRDVTTFECTYYFSYVTQRSRLSPVAERNRKRHWPTPRTHPLMMFLSAAGGRWCHSCPRPQEPWDDSLWWPNDGPCPVYSQQYPRRLGSQAGIRQACLERAGKLASKIKCGVWYYSKPIDLDHMSVSMAPRGGDKRSQSQLFDAILKRSRLLPDRSPARRRKNNRRNRESVVREIINF